MFERRAFPGDTWVMVVEERLREPGGRLARFSRLLLLFLVVMAGYGSALALAGMLAAATETQVLLFSFPFVVSFLFGIYDALKRGGRGLRVAWVVFVLGASVGMGLWTNASYLDASCVYDGCGSEKPYRALAVPEAYGLLVLHVLAVVAYCVSRRRREALPAWPEALLAGTLLSGVALHVVLGVHFAPVLQLAVTIPFLAFPVFAPYLTVILLGRELVLRLRRRAEERAKTPVWRGLLAFPGVLGAWAVLDALALRRPDAAWRTFSDTCSYAFSTLPIEEVPGNCHYLCTVAARGHASWVRPERIGRRDGRPIVVNRQLAVANAFEDLLSARLPRLARLCRRAYDRVGLPLSRWIRHPLASDAVYAAMKPAEWSFYLVLVLFDPRDPEERIARMYSPSGGSVTTPSAPAATSGA